MFSCVDTGDTAFMAFATTMVFMMTPAMALAQAGMIRRKNAASMLMQIMVGIAIGSTLYFLAGFSLSFGPTVGGFAHGGIIGTLKYSLLLNLNTNDCHPEFSGADSIPGLLYFAYQMMFAIHTPLIVTGAWVEKMTFNAFLVFVVLWPIFVYYPIAHIVWAKEGFLNKYGVMDYAGGACIHTTAGVAGLVVSLAMQRRKPNDHGTPHHSLPLAYLGCALVFAGWYSFIAGAGMKANGQAVNAFVCTHLSACASALVWTTLNKIRTGYWQVTGIINGLFAGLGSITACAGFVEPWAAFVIGTTGGFISYGSVLLFKDRLNLDDVLDCTSLQGVPGILGTVMIGLFADSRVQTRHAVDGAVLGGGFKQLGIQCVGVVTVVAWTAVFTWLIVMVMKYTTGIDVDADVEEMGLDLSQIGEQAYDDKLDLSLDIGPETLTQKLREACATGDVAEIHTLIRAGANPNGADYDRRYPIHLAASEGRLPAVVYLVTNHNVDINCRDKFGGSPILDAANNEHLATVKWLRANGATTHNTPQVKMMMFQACFKGDVKKLRLLLATGIDVDSTDYDLRTGLMVAAGCGHVTTVRLLLAKGANQALRDRWGNTALDATTGSEMEEVRDMLKDLSGVGGNEREGDEETAPLLAFSPNLTAPLLPSNPNLLVINPPTNKEEKKKYTANCREICTAAAGGRLEEMKRLVAKGGRVLADQAHLDGRTPLILAAANGHLDIIKYLVVMKEVNTNARDRWGVTALQEALNNKHAEIVTVLKAHGAVVIQQEVGYKLCYMAHKGDIDGLNTAADQGVDLNIADYDARTALHLAASEGQLAIVHWLLLRGAAVHNTDKFGYTALDDARRYGHSAIVELLEKSHQASLNL